MKRAFDLSISISALELKKKKNIFLEIAKTNTYIYGDFIISQIRFLI